MPSLRSINQEAGTNFRRWKHLTQSLKEQRAASMVQHYQIKVTEYGQVCLRAPNSPQIIGVLWRVNEHGGRSGGGHFGQAVLFPAQMRPGQNTNIDYRIGGDYYSGALPIITDEWQWIDAYPAERHETFWYGMDDVAEIPVSEYDTWLLTGEPMPGTVHIEGPDLVAQEAERQAEEEALRQRIAEENRLHNERMEQEAAELAARNATLQEEAERQQAEHEAAMAAERERAAAAAVGTVEYSLVDQMRDGLASKPDAEAQEILRQIVGHGGDYEQAARTVAAERGINL